MDTKPKITTLPNKCRPGPNGGGCTRPGPWIPPRRPNPRPDNWPNPGGGRRRGGRKSSGDSGCIIS